MKQNLSGNFTSAPLKNFLPSAYTYTLSVSGGDQVFFSDGFHRSFMHYFKIPRGGSRTAATSMMERFVIVLDAAVLDPPLHFISFSAYKDSIASFAH